MKRIGIKAARETIQESFQVRLSSENSELEIYDLFSDGVWRGIHTVEFKQLQWVISQSLPGLISIRTVFDACQRIRACS